MDNKTYLVFWEDHCISETPYSEASKFAKRKSSGCGYAKIICEEMQFFMDGMRRIPTYIWVEEWENGKRMSREEMSLRYSPRKGEYIPTDEWEREVIETLNEK